MKQSPNKGVAVLLLYASILVWVFGLPSIPFLGVSPQIILPLLTYWTIARKEKKRILGRPRTIFLVWTLALGVSLLVESTIGLNTPNFLSQVTKSFAAVALVYSIFVLLKSRLVSIDGLLYWIASLCVLSALWFILEMTITHPFSQIREGIYQRIYESRDSSLLLVENIRTGLVPFTHMIGYQLAFAIPYWFSILEKRNKTIISGVSIIICAIALHLSGQRSALVASLFGILILMINSAKKKIYLAWILAIAIALPAITISLKILNQSEEGRTAIGQIAVLEKLSDDEALIDAQFRVKLQIRAIQLLVLNPFGTILHGVDWVEEGFLYVLQNSSNVNTLNISREGEIEALAVHNGYLVTALKSGFIVLLAAIYILYASTKLTYQQYCRAQPDEKKIPATILAIFGSLCLIQSLFHNGSFLSLESMSILTLAITLGGIATPKQKYH